MRGLMIIIFIIPALMQGRGQSFTEIDQETYRLYMDKDWTELARTGREALRYDIDYYYLRMRIGIAYYERENYKSAQAHFRKALEFNPGDPIASEYLYYSYLYSGQKNDAAVIYDKFSPTLKEKLSGPGLKMMDRISVEYLYNHASSGEIIQDQNNFEGLPPGYQIITQNFQNLNFSLSHYLRPGISFLHAYTWLDKNNFSFTNDGTNSFSVEGVNVKQHQYYLSPSFTGEGGVLISPFFHYLRVYYQVPFWSDTGGGTSPGSGGNNDNIRLSNENEGNIIAGISLLKHQGTVDLNLCLGWSNLNSDEQLTGRAGITWYPGGNLNFYLGTSLSVHTADMSKRGMDFIPGVTAGYGIASKVWINLSGLYGDMKNYTESAGYIVYNGIDWMYYKVLGTLMVPLGKKGSSVYVGTRLSGNTSVFNAYDRTQPEDINTYKYDNLSIFGGILWKF